MGVPPGNRPAVPRDWFRGVPERYVAGADTRGRQEGRPYPWSQQVIHEISGLGLEIIATVLRSYSRALDIVDLRKEAGSTQDFFRQDSDMVCFSVNWDREAGFVRQEILSVPPGI